jgi:hypothetical protein
MSENELNENFIGRFNIVLKIENVWYQLPFKFLHDECIISRKVCPASYAETPQESVLIENVMDELISRWEYFEWAVRCFTIEGRTKSKSI